MIIFSLFNIFFDYLVIRLILLPNLHKEASANEKAHIFTDASVNENGKYLENLKADGILD